MAGTITLAAIDRDRMLLDGLRAWLRAEPDLALASTHPSVDDYLAGGPAVDVVLLWLGDAGPAAAAGAAVAVQRLAARVLLVAAAMGESLTAALLAGGAGYVTPDRGLPALAAAVREVAAGRPAGAGLPVATGALRLSRQERAVLLSYATGSTLQAAAHRAGVSYGTARSYLERVKRKYTEAGRPTYTKLDLASRLREDLTAEPLAVRP
jgi:two-component system, NarL family, nitrate/nitrite response regulator NarL